MISAARDEMVQSATSDWEARARSTLLDGFGPGLKKLPRGTNASVNATLFLHSIQVISSFFFWEKIIDIPE